MKILLIQPCFENFGGYFRSVGIARALAEKANNVDLLISSKNNLLTTKKEKETDHLSIYQLPRLNIHQFINGKILRGVIASFFIAFGKYDVIHIFEAVQPETNIPLIFCKLINKKVILDIDEEWMDNVMNQKGKLMAAYMKYCDLKLTPRSDYLTVTSRYLVDKYRKLGVKNILKVINGVDLKQFTLMDKKEARRLLKIPQKEKVLLAFGNTFEGERAYLLLKTYQEIWNEDKRIRLYTNFDPRKFFKDKRIKKEISPKCINSINNLGYISNDKLPSYLVSSDLVLFLMGNRASERACFPVRIGTYLNGEKVIAMNITDTEACLTLKEMGCALLGNDTKQLAQLIILFLSTPTLQRKLTKKVLLAKQRLSWASISADLLRFYHYSYHDQN